MTKTFSTASCSTCVPRTPSDNVKIRVRTLTLTTSMHGTSYIFFIFIFLLCFISFLLFFIFFSSLSLSLSSPVLSSSPTFSIFFPSLLYLLLLHIFCSFLTCFISFPISSFFLFSSALSFHHILLAIHYIDPSPGTEQALTRKIEELCITSSVPKRSLYAVLVFFSEQEMLDGDFSRYGQVG